MSKTTEKKADLHVAEHSSKLEAAVATSSSPDAEATALRVVVDGHHGCGREKTLATATTDLEQGITRVQKDAHHALKPTSVQQHTDPEDQSSGGAHDNKAMNFSKKQDVKDKDQESAGRSRPVFGRRRRYVSERRLDDHASERSKIQDKECIPPDQQRSDLRRKASRADARTLSDCNT